MGRIEYYTHYIYFKPWRRGHGRGTYGILFALHKFRPPRKGGGVGRVEYYSHYIDSDPPRRGGGVGPIKYYTYYIDSDPPRSGGRGTYRILYSLHRFRPPDGGGAWNV